MANNNTKPKYDPLEDIKRFTENKGLYDQAVAKGDNVAARQYADAGITGYLNLQANGYGDVAKRLGEADYKGALGIQNEYAKKDKVELKPYLYNSKLKTEYGLSDKDIDGIINSANGSSGFALGPINLGDPYSVVDGVEYWSPSSLDASIDQYIETQGLTPIVQEAAAETAEKELKNYNVYDKTGDLYSLQRNDHEDVSGKYNQLFDYALNQNPFETPTGQAIMSEYNLKGEKESDNAKAEGAASNGGNVDSFAQANALRQQASMTSLGQQNAIAAQSQRINDVRGVLGDLGIYQSGSYEGMQHTIALEHGINKDIAEVTGVVPFEWELRNNRYFTNGTLSNPQLDYGVIIEDIDKKLETETDPDEIASLKQQRKEAEVARAYKTSPDNYDGKYAQYAKDLGGYYQTPTRSYDADMSKIETSAMTDAQKQATTNLLNYAKSGAPITQPMLDAAGFDGYTPESFMAEYKANQPVKTTTTRTGGGGGGGNKTALTSSEKLKIYNYIEDDFDPDNPAGLTAVLSSFDWSKKDKDDAYDYLIGIYGGVEGYEDVVAVIDSYFGKSSDTSSVPSSPKQPQTAYAGDGYYANTFDPATQKYYVEGLGYFTEEELTEMFMAGELGYELVGDKIKFVKK